MKLHWRLVLLILLATLPALVALVYANAALRRDAEEEARGQALRQAEQIAGEHQRLLDGAEHLLMTLAAIPSIKRQDTETCRRVLEALHERLQGYAAVAAFDIEGRPFCANVPYWQATTAADRPWFQEAVETGGFVVGTYQEGRATGRPQLPLALPFADDAGNVQGVIALALDLGWLAATLADRLRPGASLTVSDSDGTVLVRLPEDGGWVGNPLPAPRRHEIEEAAPGVAERVDPDGIRRTIGYLPPASSPASGLHVSIGLPKAEAHADVHQVVRQGFVLVALGFVGAAAVGLVGGRRYIVGPIEALRKAVQRWRGGDTTARVAVTDPNSELGELGRAFNEMADAIEGHLEIRGLLLREVNHRVMNSLQLLSSMLYLQARGSSSIEAKAQLERARQRVLSTSLVYRRLYRAPESGSVEVGAFLRGLCEDISGALLKEATGPRLVVEADEVWLPFDRAIPIGLIVNELVTNALKHAFPGGRAGVVQVRLRRTEGEWLRLSVEDNGVGMPEDQAAKDGLGTQLIDVVAQQLGATCSVGAAGGHGTAFHLEMPLADGSEEPPGIRSVA